MEPCWGKALRVYRLASFPVSSLLQVCGWRSQLPVPAACCHVFLPWAMMDSPSGTINPNQLLLPSLNCLSHYHNDRRVTNSSFLCFNSSLWAQGCLFCAIISWKGTILVLIFRGLVTTKRLLWDSVGTPELSFWTMLQLIRLWEVGQWISHYEIAISVWGPGAECYGLNMEWTGLLLVLAFGGSENLENGV